MPKSCVRGVDLLMTVYRIPGETHMVHAGSPRHRKDDRRIVLTEFRGCGSLARACVCMFTSI